MKTPRAWLRPLRGVRRGNRVPGRLPRTATFAATVPTAAPVSSSSSQGALQGRPCHLGGSPHSFSCSPALILLICSPYQAGIPQHFAAQLLSVHPADGPRRRRIPPSAGSERGSRASLGPPFRGTGAYRPLCQRVVTQLLQLCFYTSEDRKGRLSHDVKSKTERGRLRHEAVQGLGGGEEGPLGRPADWEELGRT